MPEQSRSGKKFSAQLIHPVSDLFFNFRWHRIIDFFRDFTSAVIYPQSKKGLKIEKEAMRRSIKSLKKHKKTKKSRNSFDKYKNQCYIKETSRRDGRVDEGATLEMWCGATHRGFESLSLRHFLF